MRLDPLGWPSREMASRMRHCASGGTHGAQRLGAGEMRSWPKGPTCVGGSCGTGITLVISDPARNLVHLRCSTHIHFLTQNWSHSSSTSSRPQGRSTKRWARSAHLDGIKVLRERRGSGGAKRGWYSIGRMTVRTSRRERWPMSRPRPPHCLLPT